MFKGSLDIRADFLPFIFKSFIWSRYYGQFHPLDLGLNLGLNPNLSQDVKLVLNLAEFALNGAFVIVSHARLAVPVRAARSHTVRGVLAVIR